MWLEEKNKWKLTQFILERIQRSESKIKKNTQNNVVQRGNDT